MFESFLLLFVFAYNIWSVLCSSTFSLESGGRAFVLSLAFANPPFFVLKNPTRCPEFSTSFSPRCFAFRAPLRPPPLFSLHGCDAQTGSRLGEEGEARVVHR